MPPVREVRLAAGRFARVSSAIVAALVTFALGATVWATDANELQWHHALNYTHFEASCIQYTSLLGLGSGAFLVPLPDPVTYLALYRVWECPLAATIQYNHMRPSILCVLACVLLTLGYMLLWTAIKAVKFYATHVFLVTLYSYASGAGMGSLYSTALLVNLRNYERKHCGKVIGTMHAPMFLGPILMNAVFTDEPVLEKWIPGIVFWVQLTLAIVASFIGILFLRSGGRASASLDDSGEWPVQRRPVYNVRTGRTHLQRDSFSDVRALTEQAIEYPESDAGTENDGDESADDMAAGPIGQTSIAAHDAINRPSACYRWLKKRVALLVSVQFLGLSACFAATTAAGVFLYLNYANFLSRATHRQVHHASPWDLGMFSFLAVSMSFMSAVFGDKYRERVSRSNVLFVVCLGGALATLFMLFAIDTAGVWRAVFVTAGATIGVFWSVVPAVLRERYGVRLAGQLWPLLILESALLCLALQAAHYYLFDERSQFVASNVCDSSEYCVKLFAAVLFVWHLCATVLAFCMMDS